MKKNILVFVLVAFSALSATAQDDTFNNLVKKLTSYVAASPQEKVYLHFDKPFYAVGDDIWFKAYIVDAATSIPSIHSNILYVDLINPQGKLQTQLKLPFSSGVTWGDFTLPDGLPEGNYRIRAYTQLMRNAGPEFFFDKTLKIGSSWNNPVFASADFKSFVENTQEIIQTTLRFKDKNGVPFTGKSVAYSVVSGDQTLTNGTVETDTNGQISLPAVNSSRALLMAGKIIADIQLSDKQQVQKIIPIRASSELVDVQFMPEGGKLVEGLPSKVAFKGITYNGLGVAVKGRIIDNDGLEITTFESGYLGMGVFFINPAPGKTYQAKISLPNGSETTVTLSGAEKQGYVLTLNNTDSAKISVKTFISEELKNTGFLHLVAQHNGTVLFTTEIPTLKQMSVLTLLKSNFPSGIIQFTLFSPQNLPIAERIIFIQNNKNRIGLSIEGLKQSYAPQSPVMFSLRATNEDLPVRGSFSASVTNIAAVTPDLENESNILTGLLLTADLQGYVENPNHYFLKNDAATREELDNLMLTQGWRKISWESLQNATLPLPDFKPEKTLHISGHITTNAGKPVARGKLSLFSSSAMLALDTLSDAAGYFNFDRLQFPDSTKFVLQAKMDNKKNVKIQLDSISIPPVSLNKNAADATVNINEEMVSYLEKSKAYFDDQEKAGRLKKTGIDIKTVEIEGKRKNLAPNSSNYNGAGNADLIITAKDLQTTMSLGSFIEQGRIPGIYLERGMAYSSRVTSLDDLVVKTDENGKAYHPEKLPMAVVYNGIKVGADILEHIPPDEIESIEVIKNISGMAIYGESSGILIITSKKVGITGIPGHIPGLVTLSPKGFAATREFYMPKYEAGQAPGQDLRTTVYWNAQITTDAKGMATLDFPNTSQPGLYRMVIEGIDADGNLARKVINYTVQ